MAAAEPSPITEWDGYITGGTIIKQYKVVYVDFVLKTGNSITQKAWCKEYSFNLSNDRRSDQEFILNHYASLGWQLVQVVQDSRSLKYYFYFEKDAQP